MATEKQQSAIEWLKTKLGLKMADEGAPMDTPADNRKSYTLADGTVLMIDRLEEGGSAVSADSTPVAAGTWTMTDGTVVTTDEAGLITEVTVPVEQSQEVPEDKDARIAELQRQIAELQSGQTKMSTQMSEQKTAAETAAAEHNETLKKVLGFMEEFAAAPSADPLEKPATGTTAPSSSELKNERAASLKKTLAEKRAAE